MAVRRTPVQGRYVSAALCGVLEVSADIQRRTARNPLRALGFRARHTISTSMYNRHNAFHGCAAMSVLPGSDGLLVMARGLTSFILRSSTR